MQAGLAGVRIHDLRHSFDSIAVSGGASLPIIGALLGHAHSVTTQRYAHLNDDHLRAASDAVGRQINEFFNPIPNKDNVEKLFGKNNR